MASKSYLVTVFSDLLEEFPIKIAFNTEFDQIIRALDLEDRNKHIENMENLTFFSRKIFEMLQDLLFISKELERLGIEVKQMQSNREVLPWPTIFKKVRTLNLSLILFINNFSRTVVKKSVPPSRHAEYKEKYDEIDYVRLIRNQFLEHPEVNYSYVSDFQILNNEDLSSYNPFPGGGGYALYTQHHSSEVKDGEYNNLSYEQKLASNKSDFLKIEGWNKLSKEDQKDEEKLEFFNSLRHRIKADGLPAINQKKLADELKEVAESYVASKINRDIEVAEKDEILKHLVRQ